MKFDIERYFPDETQEVGDSGRASFREKRPLYLAASKHFLTHYREEIRSRHRAGASGEWVVKAITSMSDILITKLFRCIMDDLSDPEQADEQLTLVAIGGYGRGELNPYSDIDLMFLHSGKAPQRIEIIAQKLLYFLWDMRLDVGYSVRTSQRLRGDGQYRYHGKDRAAGQSFPGRQPAVVCCLSENAPHPDTGEEKRCLYPGKARRAEKIDGKNTALPSISSSQTSRKGRGLCGICIPPCGWLRSSTRSPIPRELIIKGVVSEEELESYDNSLSYLWRIRNELHYLAGRKNDQLTFDAQTKLAEFFGYEDKGKSLAVEEFMRDFICTPPKSSILHPVSSPVASYGRKGRASSSATSSAARSGKVSMSSKGNWWFPMSR